MFRILQVLVRGGGDCDGLSRCRLGYRTAFIQCVFFGGVSDHSLTLGGGGG